MGLDPFTVVTGIIGVASAIYSVASTEGRSATSLSNAALSDQIKAGFD